MKGHVPALLPGGQPNIGNDARALLHEIAKREPFAYKLSVNRYASGMIRIDASWNSQSEVEGWIGFGIQWKMLKTKPPKLYVVSTSFNFPGHTGANGPRLGGMHWPSEGRAYVVPSQFDDVVPLLDGLQDQFDLGCRNPSCSGRVHRT